MIKFGMVYIIGMLQQLKMDWVKLLTDLVAKFKNPDRYDTLLLLAQTIKINPTVNHIAHFKNEVANIIREWNEILNKEGPANYKLIKELVNRLYTTMENLDRSRNFIVFLMKKSRYTVSDVNKAFEIVRNEIGKEENAAKLLSLFQAVEAFKADLVDGFWRDAAPEMIRYWRDTYGQTPSAANMDMFKTIVNGFLQEYSSVEKVNDIYEPVSKLGLLSEDDHFQQINLPVADTLIYAEYNKKYYRPVVLFFKNKIISIFSISRPEFNQLQLKMPLLENEHITFVAGSTLTNKSESHYVFVTNLGNVYGFGHNHFNQRISDNNDIQRINIDDQISTVACNGSSIIFISNTGELYMSGLGYFEINFMPEGSSTVRKFRKNNANFVSVAYGDYHLIAITNSGRIYGYGNNDYGQCGNPQNRAIYELTLIEFDAVVVQAVCTYNNSVLLTDTGRVHVLGILGPQELTFPEKIIKIANHFLFVSDAGHVYRYRHNNEKPYRIANLPYITDIYFKNHNDGVLLRYYDDEDFPFNVKCSICTAITPTMCSKCNIPFCNSNCFTKHSCVAMLE